MRASRRSASVQTRLALNVLAEAARKNRGARGHAYFIALIDLIPPPKWGIERICMEGKGFAIEYYGPLGIFEWTRISLSS
jgi:hypothetical protein